MKLGFIYLMKNQRNGYVKIGYSTRPQHREKTLQSEEPEVDLLCACLGFRSDEAELHRMFADRRLRGEWFHLQPSELQALVAAFRDRTQKFIAAHDKMLDQEFHELKNAAEIWHEDEILYADEVAAIRRWEAGGAAPRQT